MDTLTVALGEKAYPIHVGAGLLGRAEFLLPFLRHPKAVVVSNVTVAPLYFKQLAEPLRKAGIDVTEVRLPDGERFKNWQTLQTIFDVLMQSHCERATTLIALGGGVVGDMAGFAAACFQRGMPFVQIPTTLLAQVDSSVGGKTAINHSLGKNMIGAFHQPRLVLTDTDTLNTLPDRELRSGLAEVIKYGLIKDLSFFEWLEANIERLLMREPIALQEAIIRSCRNKAAIVIADEYEYGERALLNLGHTFGHAIETGVGYGEWLHGEAVAVGTMMAAELSLRQGWLLRPDVERVENMFKRAGLPVCGPRLTTERYFELMQHDKKVQNGRIRLVLLRELGNAVVGDSASLIDIQSAILARSPHV